MDLAMLKYRQSLLREEAMARVPKPECASIFVAPESYAHVEYQHVEHCGEPIPKHFSSHLDYRENYSTLGFFSENEKRESFVYEDDILILNFATLKRAIIIFFRERATEPTCNLLL